MASNINNISTSAQLVGTYAGNQNINVASFLKSGDTVNNFIVETTYVAGAEVSDNIGARNWYAGKLYASSISKSLNGNYLAISGMVLTVAAGEKNEDWQQLSFNKKTTCNITYKVYHI